MKAQALETADIEVFSEAVTHFFETTCGEKAQVRTAFLLDARTPLPWGDFNGVVEASGGYSGRICFSAPRSLLSHLLLRMGQADFSDEQHLDIVGEIANIFSGRARRHFGDRLCISPPRTFAGSAGAAALAASAASSPPFAIPLCWNGYEANLVVQLDALG